MDRMERGATAADELMATQHKWGCMHVALREITGWMIRNTSEAEIKATREMTWKPKI